MSDGPPSDERVAIIGLAGHWPGADDAEAFWSRTLSGAVDVRPVADGTPGVVAVRGVVDGADRFDAGFFGISDREARLLDPQQRMLLELAQQALDDAGVDPDRPPGPVSVYAACAPAAEAEVSGSLSETYDRMLGTGTDFAATRIAYRLGLCGEALTVQTGCSSSLAAVHLAVQSLLSGQSDVALTGGASFPADQSTGYAVEDGMITSPTGACRPFDAAADGAVPGGGAALIVLRRLDDAVADGDRVIATILGSAMNNDGSTKAGFMAPSPTGQAGVIATAHAVAGLRAGSIAYVETHGTGTALGDAVEVEGLRRAFAVDSARDRPCALGSVKASIGHLDRAAGVAGLVRAALAVERGVIPPMANFTAPNPQLELTAAGFRVPVESEPFPLGGPRRAGVSAFGVGGTNVHVVLEEPPAPAGARDAGGPLLLALAGHTPAALGEAARALASHLERRDAPVLASVARTLATGRRAHAWRTAVIAADRRDAARRLRVAADDATRAGSPTVVFVFTGQGQASVDGLRGLYDGEPVFRAALDRCSEQLAPITGLDLRDDLYGDPDPAARTARFVDMGRFQPAMFAVEWALAELWRSWGVVPAAVAGHSLGEVVAAAWAGVFELEDALRFVAERGRLMEGTAPGAMLSVALPPDEVERRLGRGATIGAVNGRELVTVTGEPAAVARMEERFHADGTFCRRLHLHRAPHSEAMRPAAHQLHAVAERCRLRPPATPLLSNASGDWAAEAAATPGYWAEHLCSTVRFADVAERIAELSKPLVVEIGPGTTLARVLGHELAGRAAVVASVSGGDGEDAGDDRAQLLAAAGRAWSHGAPVDLAAPLGVPLPSKAVLPRTPFDHRRRWPTAPRARPHAAGALAGRLPDMGAWLYELAAEPLRAAPAALGRVAWVGGGGPWRDAFTAAVREAGGDVSADWTEPVHDVVWWLPDAGDGALAEAARLARTVVERAPGARVWAVAPAGERAGAVTAAALARAAARVVPQEVTGADWRAVELRGGPAGARHLAGALAGARGAPVLVVDDEGAAEVVERRAWPDWTPRPLRTGGTYVVTGGLGRVGRALVLAHARTCPAHFVVLGRRAAEAVAPELRRLRAELEPTGSTAGYVALDVADATAVARCLDDLRRARGRVDGVVHAAAFTDRSAFPLLDDTTPEAVERIAGVKVRGAAALAAALAQDDADFILLCSSASTVLGGVGFGAYVAANAALDAFAQERFAAGDRRWLSVAWDAWADGDAQPSVGPGRYALADADADELLRRVLAVRGPLVLVSTGELFARLAEVHEQVVGSAEAVEAPGGAVDPGSVVRAAVGAVLGAVPDDPHADMREHGLESLGILQIVMRLRAAVRAPIALAAAMRSLSLAALEALVAEAAAGSASAGERFSVTTAPSAERYPTSSVQRRWLELMPEGYGGIDIVIEVAGAVSTADLAAAVRAVIDRHSGVRTRFERIDGAWWQRPVAAPDISTVDLSTLPPAEREVSLAALATDAAGTWYEPEGDPPFRLVVVRLEDERHALVLHIHHVLFDGWSSSIFLRDVALAVRGELGERPLQYVDFATAQVAHLGTELHACSREFWRKHFAGAPAPTRIEADLSPGAERDRGAVRPFLVAAETTAGLRERARVLGATPFALMMAAFVALMHEATGDTDLVFGTTAAGRPSPECEEIVGVFVNPLPVRMVIDPGGTVGDLVAVVQRVLVDFHEHGHYPLEDLVSHVEPFLGAGLNDTFRCYLLYQNYWRPDDADLRFRPLPVPAPPHVLMRDLEIILEEREHGLGGELWYLTSRFSADRAQRLADRYVALLDLLAAGDGVHAAPLADVLGATVADPRRVTA